MSATLDLAQSLIRLPSVTPEDGGCQDLLQRRLGPLGFVPEVVSGGGVTNLWSRRGTARPLVVFAGHTDVVPPGPADRWASDPFVPTIRNGLLYGRGAADMKTSLAAFVVAIETFLTAHPQAPGSIALLLTSDEEGPAIDGTVRVVERLAQRGERIDYCVVGEPTSVNRLGDTIKNGRRGSLSGKLTVRGVQGHVAYPQLARNPVHQAAPALAELVAREWDRGNSDFPPTTFQISNVRAGTGAGNVIPGELQVWFNFRYCTESTADGLRDAVTALLTKHGLDFAIEWEHGAKPFLTPRGRLVEALYGAIESVTGAKADVSTTGGTSDARFIATICDEVAEFGPVNASIHKLDECVYVEDVDRLAAVYRGVLERLLPTGQDPAAAEGA